MRIFLFSIKSAFEVEGEKMKYLVIGSEGPGFASPEESVELLEKGVFPTFDALLKLETEKKILAGGLPLQTVLWSSFWRPLPMTKRTRYYETYLRRGVLKWRSPRSRASRDARITNVASLRRSRKNLRRNKVSYALRALQCGAGIQHKTNSGNCAMANRALSM